MCSGTAIPPCVPVFQIFPDRSTARGHSFDERNCNAQEVVRGLGVHPPPDFPDGARQRRFFGAASRAISLAPLGTVASCLSMCNGDVQTTFLHGSSSDGPANGREKSAMEERLVDVLDSRGAVIHTYPVTLGQSGNESNDSAYETKALEAAAHGRLVPDAQLASLSSRIHVSRGGQMAPYGDSVASSSETQSALEQAVRERAYFLWEQDARPVGNAEEYWHRALEQHLRERAYVLWEQEGRPAGRADEFWHRIRNFEAPCTFIGR